MSEFWTSRRARLMRQAREPLVYTPPRDVCDLANWQALPAPQCWTEAYCTALVAAQRPGFNGYVFSDHGRLKAGHVPATWTPSQRTPPFWTPGQCFLPQADGWLVGENRGEFGGGLHWYSQDGHASYRITDEPLVALYQGNRELWALDGLNHLGCDWGSLMRVHKPLHQSRWCAQEVARLPHAPTTMVQACAHSFYVATYGGLLHVNVAGYTSVLIGGEAWTALQPSTSIVLDADQGRIFIGMRGGVWEHTLHTAGATFRMPPNPSMQQHS